MKLYIQQNDGDGANLNSVTITDDRGEKLPGVRGVRIAHNWRDCATVSVDLVVNGQGVIFGTAPAPVSAPRREPRSELSFDELRARIIRALPGERLAESDIRERLDWGGVAFTWCGEYLIVLPDLIVFHVVDKPSSETALALAVRALLERDQRLKSEAPEQVAEYLIKGQSAQLSDIWKKIHEVLDADDVTARGSLGAVRPDGSFNGVVRFTWNDCRYEVDHLLNVKTLGFPSVQLLAESQDKVAADLERQADELERRLKG